MELLPLVCLCLLSCSGDAVRVEVREGSDAVLPCLISTEDLEGNKFDWKKDGQKEVFLYDAGIHYNNGLPGQDQQFKGRVSHFQDQLQNGDASIKITRTKVDDSGNYRCDFPRLQSQTFIIELVVDPRVRVLVEQDSDAVLNCSLSTEDLTGQLFDWKKDGQKEVFIYGNGSHYNNGRQGQDEQFRGRVSHFQDQLQNGDASIKITRTKMDDSGIYSCIFPRLQSQTFYIKLVVGQVLKDRRGEEPGAAPRPIIHRPRDTKDSSLLQCEAQGVPPLKVEWKDSDNNTLKSESTPESEKGDHSSHITVNITVTKTDDYRCVATQRKFSHQIFAQTSVYIQGAAPEPGSNTRWIITVVFLTLLLLVAVVGGGVCCWLYKRRDKKIKRLKLHISELEEPQEQPDSKSEKKIDGEKTDPEESLNPLEKSVRVEVKEGSDAVLPCLISTEDLTGKLFDWRKDGQKEVFMYAAGIHYNNGLQGQDEQFKGRVSQFQDQLQNGDASIKITKTTVADSGTYSCDFPHLQPRQTSIIELVVDPGSTPNAANGQPDTEENTAV